MDINSLPMELLQHIMSFLDFKTLKAISLVCHRWHSASARFITRNGNMRITKDSGPSLSDIRNCWREYQNMSIKRMKWPEMRSIMRAYVERYQSIRELVLTGCLQGYLGYLYGMCSAEAGWMESCESLHVEMNFRCDHHLILGPREFELTMPSLKYVQWVEYYGDGYGVCQKTVTINAPNIERIYFRDNKDDSSLIRIPMSDRLKFIRCIFFSKRFTNMFVGNITNVETLILDVVVEICDITFLKNMHNLRYLRLNFGNKNTSLLDVEEIDCKQLKVLSIMMPDVNPDLGGLRLDKIFNNFANLDTLDLTGIEVFKAGSFSAKHLTFLQLRDVDCTSNIILNLPRLERLSISSTTMSNIRVVQSKEFKELFLHLQLDSMKEGFDLVAKDFILNHKSVKRLVLIRGDCKGAPIDGEIEDDAWYDAKEFGLETLELHETIISINFFRMLSVWKSLRNLTIISCTINCDAVDEHNVQYSGITVLPCVKRMRLDNVKVKGSESFPLRIGEACEIYSTLEESDVCYHTRPHLEKYDPPLKPLAWREIDPFDYV